MSEAVEYAASVARGRAWAAIGRGMRARELARLPLATVAAACNVNAATVHRWERGVVLPQGDHAVLYAELIERLEADAAERESIEGVQA